MSLNLVRTSKNADQVGQRANRLVARIRKEHDALKTCSETKLVQYTEELRERIRNGRASRRGKTGGDDRNLVTAFALMTEAIRRTYSKTYYDVQLQGGLILASGAIAEMQTGEGKTITAGLPALVHGLMGRGVHVGTTNSYLAERDYEELRPPLELLGLSVSFIQADLPPQEKRRAYECDVTYGPGYEFGFDFLRDQIAMRGQTRLPLGTAYLARLRGMSLREQQLVQRGHAIAIIDEADSVLIDEATTPLVLSGAPSGQAVDPTIYRLARQTALSLEEDNHYRLDAAGRKLTFTTPGWTSIHDIFTNTQLPKLLRPWSAYVENALRAEFLLKRDEDYVVRDDEVQIVDQNTGRIHPERSWRSGLHQAVEVKEGADVREENQSQARISRQRYFRFYDGICGLTGTAQVAATELDGFYRLPVVSVPTNQPCQRRELPERFFTDADTKNVAIANEIKQRHATGQPILVGTRTIRESHRLSELLGEAGITHKVLNGMQDEEEASIIARAGQPCAVTIATNMAGRGTDIKIANKSRTAGGLHVVAAEHHESPRVDRQLVGRAARQGDPGSFQFFVSAEDQLLQSNKRLADSIRRDADELGECQQDLSKEIGELQQQSERRAYERRQQLMRNDHWMESVLESVAKQVG